MNAATQLALSYAEMGWPVLPVHSVRDGLCGCGEARCPSIGKHPCISGWPEAASTDETKIREWSDRFPDHNVGILTGGTSGPVVLDVDPRNGGDASLAELAAEIGGLPHTLVVRTGGDGQHFYFQNPGQALRSKPGLRPGLDLKADGGYVVAPPSNHASGRSYFFMTPPVTPLAPLPETLLEQLREESPTKGSLNGRSAPRLLEGERNSALTSLAGTMRRRGMTQEAIQAALQRENYIRSDPPLDEDEVRRIAASVSRYNPALSTPTGQKRESQSTRLIKLAEEIELFHSLEGEPFASFVSEGHRETWRLRSPGFRRWLSHMAYAAENRVPRAQEMQDALLAMEGEAVHQGTAHPVCVRLAQVGDAIYLDLANESWHAIEVTGQGWRVVTEPPVRFQRPRGLLSLPMPEPGGVLSDLGPFLNIQADADAWLLLLGWMVMALRPSGPYPILILQGQQGSAKSTCARVLRSLLDPGLASLRALPRNEHELMIAATNGRVLAFDNLSHVPPWGSDALCRLATGAGLSARELYSDAEEVIFEGQRPVILTGIEELASRGDLLDRSVLVDLAQIPPGQYRPEGEFWKAFEAARPRLLGAVLDAVSTALRRWPEPLGEHFPRMADFARWATAAEPAFGCPHGGFLRAYRNNMGLAHEVAVEASPVGEAVRALVGDGSWTGTATELRAALESRMDHAPGAWPKTALGISNALRRVEPNLRAIGIEVSFYHEGHEHRRIISIKAVRRDSYRIHASASSALPDALQAGANPSRSDLTNADAADAADDVSPGGNS